MSEQQAGPGMGRIVTIPNVLSFLRLLGVPVFLWLVLWPVFGGPQHDWYALLILVLSGVTDYLDGKLARRWNQITRLGQLLDPAADRLYVLSTLVGLAARGIIPWWLLVVLVGRDLVLAIPLMVLRRYGYGPPPVHFIGKAATFCLMYAFPLLLLSRHGGVIGMLAAIFGWAFAIWGTATYWLAGAMYITQTRRIVTAARRAESDRLERRHSGSEFNVGP